MDVLDHPPELILGKRGNVDKFVSPDGNPRTTLEVASTVLKPVTNNNRWGGSVSVKSGSSNDRATGERNPESRRSGSSEANSV
eukprot:16380777-Heterocapsa_arctica.AAC.1